MNILVCVKQVIDTEGIRTDKETHTLILDGVPLIVNPYDACALETAVRIKEANAGSQVIVLSYGAAKAQTALRDCLAVGADKAYLVSDDALDGLDSGYVLAESIKKVEEAEGKLDLIFCGAKAIDADNGQVGSELAERLGIAQVTYAVEAEMDGDKVKVKKEGESGYVVLGAELPCLITMTQTAYDPRYPTIKSKMAAKKAKITTFGAGDLAGLDTGKVPLMKIDKEYVPVRNKETVIVDEGSLEESSRKLVSLLSEASVI